ncbi:hypothetical protein H8E88_29945 [candidate division KSB1 bacterium]|nr:hypothetical protein [candidate division KSB1 bacterium]
MGFKSRDMLQILLQTVLLSVVKRQHYLYKMPRTLKVRGIFVYTNLKVVLEFKLKNRFRSASPLQGVQELDFSFKFYGLKPMLLVVVKSPVINDGVS